MIKVLKLEWLKFSTYTPFLIVVGLFGLVYILFGSGIKWFVDWLVAEEGELNIFLDTGLPVFDFVDIWQNLAYISFILKIVPAFIVIISICLEYSNRTIRQNFIDGLSRREFLMSKIGLMLFLTLMSGLLLTVLGMVLGFLYSPVKSFPFIILNMEFVLAHMYEVFCYLCFALVLAALIRRTGFTIILFTLYTLAIEPIAMAIMKYEYDLPTWYLPVASINNIVRVPFPKYIFREVQDFVALQDLAVAGAWAALFLFLTYRLIQTRDV